MIVKWKILPFMPVDAPDEVVWVNVGRVDEVWAASNPNTYISAEGGGAAKPGCYVAVGNAILCGEIMEMPQVGFEDAILEFVDGRHRFAWCRDHGITALPVLTPPDCVAELTENFGASVSDPLDYRSVS